MVALIGGSAVGAAAMPRLLWGSSSVLLDRRVWIRRAMSVAGLILLVNLPLIVTEVGYSARTFTPTWLVLSGAVGAAGAHVQWKRPLQFGAVGEPSPRSPFSPWP